ncbi:hypothetical protein HZH68_003869 [Vespula germanica]|uniref:Uncharacterized protein n=1 Tax=Vespula germanica TaxID=30212 RepID=A0A834NJ99_VESGE|nr:hypothetical protein HZH68_003869 [Vespula germanica]
MVLYQTPADRFKREPHALGDEEEIRETLEWASTEGGYGGGEADDGGGDRADDGASGSGSSGDERERDTFPLD